MEVLEGKSIHLLKANSLTKNFVTDKLQYVFPLVTAFLVWCIYVIASLHFTSYKMGRTLLLHLRLMKLPRFLKLKYTEESLGHAEP